MVLTAGDPGERIERSIEEVTGLATEGCPWQAMRDPFVGAVVDAHRWIAKGVALETLYPLGVPYALIHGLREYELALDAVLACDQRRAHEDMAERLRAQGDGADFRRLPSRRGPR